MQWDNTLNGGFSKGNPWIKSNSNYVNINVEKQLIDENSTLNFYKKMIKIRKENQSLIYGDYKLILENDEKIFAYERVLENEKFLVICNLSNDEVNYEYEKLILKYNNLMICNYKVNTHEDLTKLNLKPWEARLYKI